MGVSRPPTTLPPPPASAGALGMGQSGTTGRCPQPGDPTEVLEVSPHDEGCCAMTPGTWTPQDGLPSGGRWEQLPSCSGVPLLSRFSLCLAILRPLSSAPSQPCCSPHPLTPQEQPETNAREGCGWGSNRCDSSAEHHLPALPSWSAPREDHWLFLSVFGQFVTPLRHLF